MNKFSFQLVAIPVLLALCGCATSPNAKSHEDTAIDASLSDSQFDVLFATEFPVESEEDAMARGDKALMTNELEKALFFYVKALTYRPDNPDLLARIGRLHEHRENTHMAKRAYELALTHDDRHAVSLQGLGLIILAGGQEARARHYLESSVAADARLWRAHNALGVLADQRDEYESALNYYDAALASRPNSGLILNNRGYSKFLAENYDDAARDFYAAAHENDFQHAWVNLGMLYAHRGWYEDAIETYRKVLSEPSALNDTAHIAMQNGDYVSALGFLKKAISLSPSYFPAAEQNLAALRTAQSDRSFLK